MNNVVRLLAILITLVSISACQANSVSKESVSEEFIQLFDYEIQNRAFALDTMKALVEDGEPSETLIFFKAYLALEQLNQQRFTPVSDKYQLEMQPRWWTRTRTQLGLWVTALMPQISLTTIHKATMKYVDQLQSLEQLAPQEDKSFFAYVVAQERAQADAVRFLIAGEQDKGITLLNNFITANSVEYAISSRTINNE